MKNCVVNFVNNVRSFKDNIIFENGKKKTNLISYTISTENSLNKNESLLIVFKLFKYYVTIVTL